jgi:ribosomal protein S14
MKKSFFRLIKNIFLLKKYEYQLMFNKCINVTFKIKIILNVKNLIKNICFETYKKRSFNTFFFLSRMSLKKNQNLGLINGFKKIS